MFRRSSSSSMDSDISRPSTSSGGESSFRVSVCLRRYFSDVRARAYMLARGERSVGWLQRRLRRAFGLPGAFCLRAAGHLLPPAEPLRLLRAGDCVEVIPLEEAQTGIQHGMKQIHGAKAEEKTVTSTSVYFGAGHASDGGYRSPAHTGAGNRSPTRVGAPDDEADAPLRRDVSDEQAAQGSPARAERVPGGDERALQSLKRRALDLLDVRFGPEAADDSAAAELGVPRRRRRVRRRTRRAPTPPFTPQPAPEPACRAPTPTPQPTPTPAPEPARCAPTSPPTRRAPTPPRVEARPPGDVARNEDACARRPRMVHSLDVDNVV